MNAKFNPVIKLVDVQKGEPTTTTLQIAIGLGLTHKTVIQLVRTYLPDIQEFGRVKFESANSAFEMANSERESTRGRHTRYAVLNEQQSYFLMTFMRNDFNKNFAFKFLTFSITKFNCFFNECTDTNSC